MGPSFPSLEDTEQFASQGDVVTLKSVDGLFLWVSGSLFSTQAGGLSHPRLLRAPVPLGSAVGGQKLFPDAGCLLLLI